MDDLINIENVIQQTFKWARKKEDLKTSDFVSVLLQGLKHCSKDFYRVSPRDINCVISGKREFKYIFFNHPYRTGLNYTLNTAFQKHNNIYLSLESEVVRNNEFSIENVKNFKF